MTDDAVAGKQDAGTAKRAVQIALLGSALTAGWLLVSLLFPPASASADEPGDGLLGAVHGVATATTDLVAATTSSVDALGSSVVEAVAPVVAPVATVLPQPARDAVSDAVGAVGAVVEDAVAGVDSAATNVVSTATSTVEAVTADTPLAGLVGSAPTVDGVLPPLPLSPLDEVVELLQPSPRSPAAPGIPAAVPPSPERFPTVVPVSLFTSAGRMLGAVGTLAAAGLVTSAEAISGLGGAFTPGGAGPGPAPAGTALPPGAGSIALGAAALAAFLAGFGRPRLASHRSALPVSSALPGAPVYATDTTPD